jgi:hypothetical protein
MIYDAKSMVPLSIQKGNTFLDMKFLNGPLILIHGTIPVTGCMCSRALQLVWWAGTWCFAMSRLTTIATD